MPLSDPTLLAPDYEHISRLRAAGVLVPLDPTRLPSGGWCKICCPDGHRHPEHLGFFFDFTKKANQGALTCCHPINILGGPAAVPARSPAHKIECSGLLSTTSEDWVRTDITRTLPVKGGAIKNMALVSHFPCGMMLTHRVGIVENLTLSFLAKDRMRELYGDRFSHYKVLLHVEIPGGKFATYLVNREKFNLYVAMTNEEASLAECA